MRSITSSRISGTVNAPPSKSMTGRAIAAALLAEGTTIIKTPSYCDDALAAIRVAETLGAGIIRKRDKIVITGNGALKGEVKGNLLDCGESGLTMRMFAPIACLLSHEVTLGGSGSLLKRPMNMIERIGMIGALCRTEKGFPPVVVKGPLRGGLIGVDASVTSQFLTGLLMALPLCGADSRVIVTRLASRPYVAMTLSLLGIFGIEVDHDEQYDEFFIKGNQAYKSCVCKVEGDWSGAAFLLVAGAIAGALEVRGLNMDSFQADKAIMEALTKAGAEIIIGADSISVKKKELKGFEFDATDCPDLFPPLVALAANCSGKSTLYGAERLRHKESDRAAVLASEFAKLGIKILLTENRMEVFGGNIKGDSVESRNDHRIAMACAIAALNGEGEVTIGNSECVSKSYPDFFETLERIRVSS
ncbi:MAG: 3-phosphoshikimate 1-carboxyvinyltransferase [Syntrophus sp. (in: bacteria)]|nr:3-phosphoshikimate 1-carboxyvinyltransferase [Syntrophus sp. (in: bacteria)]